MTYKFSRKIVAHVLIWLILVMGNVAPAYASEEKTAPEEQPLSTPPNQPVDSTPTANSTSVAEPIPNNEKGSTVPDKTDQIDAAKNAQPKSGQEALAPGIEQTASSNSTSPASPDSYNFKFDKLRNLSGFKGDFQASLASGAATYNYPLALPPGRNGLTPGLALTYSSQNRKINSLVGYGWDLTIPEIRRVNTHGSEFIYQRNDFYLNLYGQGGMLVPVNVSGSDGEYRAQFEDGAFLSAYLSGNKWIVSAKDGTKYTFGGADSSKLKFNDDLSANTYLWKLSEIRDSNDNFIKFTYEIEEDTSYQQKGAPYPRQIYPVDIIYTGHGSTEGPIKVHFSRTNRVDSTLDYTPIEYALATKKIINQIDIQVNDVTRRQYFLNYDSQAQRLRSLLKIISEKGYNSAGETVQLNPTTFDYEQTAGSWGKNYTIEGSLPPLYFLTKNADSNGITKDEGVRITDVNGDALPDLIQGLTEYTHEAIGSQVKITVSSSLQTYLNKSYVDANGKQVIKFVKDSVNYPLNGSIVSYVVDKNGPQTYLIKSSEARLADYNGDYLLDLMGASEPNEEDKEYSQSYVYLNNLVNGWFGETTYDPSLSEEESRDINGDGLVDLLHIGNYSFPPASQLFVNVGKRGITNPSGYLYQESPVWRNSIPLPYYNESNDRPYGLELSDANGDGLPDALEGHRETNSSGQVYNYNRVFLNTGKGFEQKASSWSTPVVFMHHKSSSNINTTNDEGNRVSDFNGDGLMDFTGNYGTYINNGVNGWFQSPGGDGIPMVYDENGYTKDAGTRLADINGDGLDDVITLYQTKESNGSFTTYQEIKLNQGKPIDLLKKVTNPYGGTIEIGYKPSTAYREADGKMSNALPFVTQTVSDVRINDNNGITSASKYTYKKGRFNYYDFQNRDFAGFGEVVEEKDEKIIHYYFYTGDSGQDRPIEPGQRDYKYNKYSEGQMVRFEGGYDFTSEAYVIDNGQKRSLRINDPAGNYVKFYLKSCLPFYSSRYAWIISNSPNNDWDKTLLVPLSREELEAIPTGPAIPYNEVTDYSVAATAALCGNVLQNNPPATTKIYPAGAALNGKIYRQNVSDQAGHKFLESFSQWTVDDLLPSATPGYERYFAKLTKTVAVDYEGGTSFKAKAGQYEYDSYGNITKETQLGEVNINPDTGEITGDINPADNIIQETNYAIKIDKYLFAPKDVTLKDSQGIKQKQQRFYYDNLNAGEISVGNLTKQEAWLKTDYGPGAGRGTTIKLTNTDEPITVQTKTFAGDCGLFGLPDTITDALGHATTYTYDSNCFYPTKITYPVTTNEQGQTVNHLEHFTYDYATGQVLDVTDQNGQLFRKAYDGLGRLKKEYVPDNTGNLVLKTLIEYQDSHPDADHPHGKVLKQRDRQDLAENDINAWHFAYEYMDGFDRTIQTKSETEGNQWIQTDLLYDKSGNVYRQRYPRFSSTGNFEPVTGWTGFVYSQMTYDALNRAVATTAILADGSIYGTTTVTYLPWQETHTDMNGQKKDLLFDVYGRLIQVKEFNRADAEGNATPDYQQYLTQYNYDLTGNLTKITDSEGNIRELRYDSLDRRLALTDLHYASKTNWNTDFGVYYFVYDTQSNLTGQHNLMGEEVSFSYDNLNRPVKEDLLGTSPIEKTYFYDDTTNGNFGLSRLSKTLAQNINPDNTGQLIDSRFAYDRLGNVINETKIMGGKTFIKIINFDILGRPMSLTYPDNYGLRYEYNPGLLLEKVFKKKTGEVETDIVKSLDYTPTGQIVTQVNASSTETQNTYDPNQLYRLTQKITYNGRAEKLQNLSYQYDKVGNILKIVDLSENDLKKTSSYAYDDIYRLLSATITESLNNTNYVQTFRYSATGNILYKSDQGLYQYAKDIEPSSKLNPQAVLKIVNSQNQPVKQFTYDQKGNFSTSRIFPPSAVSQASPSPIMSLPFNEAGGATTFKDNSGNNNNATCLGTTCPTAGQTGQIDKSVLWDGVNDYLTVKSTDGLSPSTSFTFSVWIKPNLTGLSSSQIILNKAGSYKLNLTKAGDLTVSFVNLLGKTLSLTALKGLKSGVWQKITASYSGSELKIYLNGALKIKKSQTGNIRKNTGVLTLGGLNSKLAPSALTGALDELKIYNSALTDGDVKKQYEDDTKPPSDPNLTTFSFNYANQLVKAVKGSTASYFNYDAASQRVSKLTGVHTNLYPFAGYEFESSSDPATAFSKTSYTISGDSQTDIKETISTKSLQSGMFYTHTDHLGSSSVTTGVEGSIRQIVDYYPFGSSHFEKSWDNYENDYKYTGKEQDEEIGLYYYGARYYEAAVGRWVSVDPLQITKERLVNTQGFNTYAYTRNNPINAIDLFGLDTALIFYGREYKKGRKENAYKEKAEGRANELRQQDAERVEQGQEPLYKDGIVVVDGTRPNNWQEALKTNKDISLIIYYGHARPSDGLLLDSVEDNKGKNWTLAVPTAKLDEYYNKQKKYLGSDIYITALITGNVTSDAQIYLFGCNTGKGGRNSIAFTFADHFKVPTVGVLGYINFKGYYPYVNRAGFNSNLWSTIGFKWFDIERLVSPDYQLEPKLQR